MRKAKDILSTALHLFLIVWRHEEGESGLRGKKDEGARAEKLNAKLRGLWERISPNSLRTHKWSDMQFKSKLYRTRIILRDEQIDVQKVSDCDCG